jgi:hypothetical protein
MDAEGQKALLNVLFLFYIILNVTVRVIKPYDLVGGYQSSESYVASVIMAGRTTLHGVITLKDTL